MGILQIIVATLCIGYILIFFGALGWIVCIAVKDLYDTYVERKSNKTRRNK